MEFGDLVYIKGLGAVTVNAVFPDGSFTVTADDGSVQGPYTAADLEG
jgi:predicted NUDIX family NTP pyrophosphohydrolase